jgi:hypothetical protein
LIISIYGMGFRRNKAEALFCCLKKCCPLS